jgi:channel protein (hemolysin III family)
MCRLTFRRFVHLKDVLHRCDRAMIYVFIAATYFPWLNYEPFQCDVLLPTMRILIWIMAAVGILYQQIFHEKYKWLETTFYVIMGIGPSIAIIGIVSMHNETNLASLNHRHSNKFFDIVMCIFLKDYYNKSIYCRQCNI